MGRCPRSDGSATGCSRTAWSGTGRSSTCRWSGQAPSGPGSRLDGFRRLLRFGCHCPTDRAPQCLSRRLSPPNHAEAGSPVWAGSVEPVPPALHVRFAIFRATQWTLRPFCGVDAPLCPRGPRSRLRVLVSLVPPEAPGDGSGDGTHQVVGQTEPMKAMRRHSRRWAATQTA